MALTGRSGVRVVKASTSKLFQPKTRSAGVSSPSPQSRSIVGPFPPPSTSTPASARRTDAGSGGGPFRPRVGPPATGVEGQALGGVEGGVGEKPHPVARMMGGLAQIEDEVDRVAAARPKKQRRPIGRDPRAVRGDQQIRLQEFIFVLCAEFVQSGGAHFLSHLNQNLGVEAEAAALGDDRRQRGDVDAVLSLVVG